MSRLSTAQQRHLSPDAVSVTSALRCAQRYVGDGLAGLLSELRRARLVPDSLMLEVSEALMAKGKNWAEALQRLDVEGLNLVSLNSFLVMLQRGGAPWQLALQLFQKSSVDAISISSMVAIQEDCQQLPALLGCVPLLQRRLAQMLRDVALPQMHCSNGKSVAINGFDLLAALGLMPMPSRRALEAKTLRLLQHDLAALDHRTSHLEEMPTAGTLLMRELMRWEKAAVPPVPSKFMLYLRADETVDIDTALQELGV
ncbi:unnamed protein product, partial [Cladocopium goreaui]